MFLRSTNRHKDGKDHRYYSVVDTCRVRDERPVQKTLLYWGEINDSQKAAWVRTIEMVEGREKRQIALFPEDREIPAEWILDGLWIEGQSKNPALLLQTAFVLNPLG